MSGQNLDIDAALSKAKEGVAKLKILADKRYELLLESYQTKPQTASDKDPTTVEVYEWVYKVSEQPGKKAMMYAFLTSLNACLQKDHLDIHELYIALGSFLQLNIKHLLDITGLSEHSEQAEDIPDVVMNIGTVLEDKLTASPNSLEYTEDDLDQLEQAFQQWLEPENPPPSMLFSRPSRGDSAATTEFQGPTENGSEEELEDEADIEDEVPTAIEELEGYQRYLKVKNELQRSPPQGVERKRIVAPSLLEDETRAFFLMAYYDACIDKSNDKLQTKEVEIVVNDSSDENRIKYALGNFEEFSKSLNKNLAADLSGKIPALHKKLIDDGLLTLVSNVRKRPE